MASKHRRCQFIKPDGEQCQRMCRAGYDYCWQHKDEQEYDHNAFRDLTTKQSLFIDHYLISFNATKAAKMAGYAENSAGVTGCELLKNPKIKDAIDKKLDEIKDELIAERDEILRLYTAQLRDSDLGAAERKQAADSLAKVYGLFIDKAEVKLEEVKLEDYMDE